MGKKLTLEEFTEKANIIHNFKFDYSKSVYISNKNKIIIICPIHGEFEQTPNNHLTGYGCNKCSCNITNRKNTRSHSKFLEDAKNIHGDTYDYSVSEYVHSKKTVDIICKIHGMFKQKPIYHINYKSGCPKCRNSKAVIEINNILVNGNIEFVTEKRFYDCRNKNPLPFDFYFKKFNLCIEYDGEQHFKDVTHWGGIDGYNKIMLNDNIKTEYCIKNNIRLLRIKYNEDHVSVLKQYFKNNFNIDL